MTYDTYILLLCSIVYVLLASISVVVVVIFTRMQIRLIRCGAEDEKLVKDYKKNSGKKPKGKAFDYAVAVFFSILFLAIFSFSVYVNLQENKYFKDIPTLKVVNSASMSKKHEKNTYLTENGLDDQFQTFDLILMYEIPKEEELQLYDIVAYEVDDMLIVHRIVEIEEPNEKHPDERYFLLQGDAVESPDRFPVYYSQMRAIYRGQRVPFIGSFVSFLQSPVGWMCLILIALTIIATPIIDKKIETEWDERTNILIQKAREKSASRGQGYPNALPAQWGAPVVVYPVYYNPNQRTGQATPPKGKGGKK